MTRQRVGFALRGYRTRLSSGRQSVGQICPQTDIIHQQPSTARRDLPFPRLQLCFTTLSDGVKLRCNSAFRQIKYPVRAQPLQLRPDRKISRHRQRVRRE
ncbi:unnamed protein product [Protopolystoma xenopodis]|uniref:Uncharacterized protein n=1 Tax=Protopolystoma xenopodis TaxID=117903 RepID=A0A3S5CHZ1_9PLAT|nr:unnamed protein product [Protopolystoma xenopodis]